MHEPLVSIIIPCYNQAIYLNECLESVYNQIFIDWECIIVNDGSPDCTEEIANKWIKKDIRFKYIFQENSGVSRARNTAIKMAKGVFILPLDADDKISANYIELAINSFQENNLIKVVYCKAKKFGDEKGLWDLKPFSLFELSRENLIFCSALYRKDDWGQVGGYDTNMKDGLEDWEFWIALLKNGGLVKCLDEVGFFYRIKTESRQKQITKDNYKDLFEYLSIKHADFFVKHFGSFHALSQETINIKSDYEEKLESEKFIINMFTKKFFGFTVFRNMR